MSDERLIKIEYYSDILCVWAWIAQRRIDELNKKLAGKIEIEHLYVDIFGDVPSKMEAQWASRGGYEAFAEHVKHSAAGFDTTLVSDDIWSNTRPLTSANAHLFLKAVESALGKAASIHMALTFRQAFFCDCADIGDMSTLFGLTGKEGFALADIRSDIESGKAMAALMGDYQKAKQRNVAGSPSYVIDGGRQILYGNVGYRVIHANIEQLLMNPGDEASWC